MDPINKIICASEPDLNQTTCWDKDKSPLQFQCDGDSHYYLYKYIIAAGAPLAVFQFNLEYGDINDWANLDPPWHKAQAACANLEYIKPL